MLKVTPNDDYTLLIEFEYGNKVLFNMERLIKTMRYSSLKNIDNFKNVKLKEKAICWQDDKKVSMLAVELTVDNILFMLRD